MENTLLIKMVQGQVGYIFKNPDLLLQAFTRRSYARENGGEDNEVLEFIGDKVNTPDGMVHADRESGA